VIVKNYKGFGEDSEEEDSGGGIWDFLTSAATAAGGVASTLLKNNSPTATAQANTQNLIAQRAALTQSTVATTSANTMQWLVLGGLGVAALLILTNKK
jgi:hypothetical protein